MDTEAQAHTGLSLSPFVAPWAALGLCQRSFASDSRNLRPSCPIGRTQASGRCTRNRDSRARVFALTMSRYELVATQWVESPPERVVPFFEAPENLEQLTPPFLRFRIRTQGELKMRPGAIIDYTISLRGLPLGWRTSIEEYEPGARFIDTQLRGPYRLWRHLHTFEAERDGTRLSDRVEFELPFGTLGDLAFRLFVRADLEKISPTVPTRSIAASAGTPVDKSSASARSDQALRDLLSRKAKSSCSQKPQRDAPAERLSRGRSSGLPFSAVCRMDALASASRLERWFAWAAEESCQEPREGCGSAFAAARVTEVTTHPFSVQRARAAAELRSCNRSPEQRPRTTPCSPLH
jgi:ligand-binding SRPBCC domain-containing protein